MRFKAYWLRLICLSPPGPYQGWGSLRVGDKKESGMHRSTWRKGRKQTMPELGLPEDLSSPPQGAVEPPSRMQGESGPPSRSSSPPAAVMLPGGETAAFSLLGLRDDLRKEGTPVLEQWTWPSPPHGSTEVQGGSGWDFFIPPHKQQLAKGKFESPRSQPWCQTVRTSASSPVFLCT